jgi:hypothetical protein
MAALILVWISQLTHQEDHVVVQRHKEILRIWEQKPARMRLEAERYLRILFAYLDTILQVGLLQDAQSTIAKLKRLLAYSPELNRSDGYRVYWGELKYYLNKHQFEEAAKAAHALEQGLEIVKSLNAPVKVAIIGNLVGLWFCVERWKACIKWIEQLVRQQREALQHQFAVMARIMRMICNLELGELDRAKQQARALTKFCIQAGGVQPFESEAIGLLEALSNDETGDHSLPSYQAMHSLFAYHADITRPYLTELQAWAKSRIEGKRIVEALRSS